MMPHIVILGTCDTKLDEFIYLRQKILDASSNDCKVTLVDVGRSNIDNEYITVSQQTLTTHYAPTEPKDVSTLPRGEVIKYMISCAANWFREAWNNSSNPIHGVISAGGTGGTSLATGVMRQVLPIGFPKLMVSTAASGDTGPIIGEVDITMMYSVVDIAGANSLLKTILSNAAGAIVGMAKAYESNLKDSLLNNDSEKAMDKKRVGLTMFGVTTPCVDIIRQHLESRYPIECFVFHCTGHGGLAMERLVEEGRIDAVLDITTTEICDHLIGGVMSAGPKRMEAPLKVGIPYIISVGATDMANFGPRETVPERFSNRKLYEHNPTVTLMRTNEDEAKAIGDYIVGKIQYHAKDREQVGVVLPLGGISMIATPSGPFEDKAADTAMFDAIRNGLVKLNMPLIEDERAINDKGFAIDIAELLVAKIGL